MRNLLPLLCAAVCAIAVALALRGLLPRLTGKKMGQHIFLEGPVWHQYKEGTPTMGGLAFFPALLIIAAFFLFSFAGREQLLPAFLVLGYAALNGTIGFADDLAKHRSGENKGLSAGQKFTLQLAAAAVFLLAMAMCGFFDGTTPLPFTDKSLPLGAWAIVPALLLLTGTVNSVNLTDGVDGLAGSVVGVIALFFAVAALLTGHIAAAILAGGIFGILCGFLPFNHHPAKIFMGDTGSLLLGAAVAGLAFLIDEPLILFLAAFVPMVETLTDIIQVAHYKRTHRRVFPMTPIHHSFEKIGWSENKIVLVFTAVTAATCALALLGVLL